MTVGRGEQADRRTDERVGGGGRFGYPGGSTPPHSAT